MSPITIHAVTVPIPAIAPTVIRDTAWAVVTPFNHYTVAVNRRLAGFIRAPFAHTPSEGRA